MVPRTVAGNISREATTLPGNISGEAMRTALAVDQYNAALQAALLNPDPKAQLGMANSLWMHLSENPVLPSFVSTNETYYAAKIGDLSGAPADVNAWVASETNGLIKKILPPRKL